MCKKVTGLVMALLILALLPSAGLAQTPLPPGSLDPSFSGDGKDIITANLAIRDLQVQPDGKILLTGIGFNATADVFVRRQNPDGSLDNTFSDDGRITTTFGPHSDEGIQILLEPDGKVIIVAATVPSSGGPGLGLVRYHSNGGLDTTFGANGKTVTVNGRGLFPQSALLLPNGQIIVAGWALTNDAPPDHYYSGRFLARYNANGILDETFGTGGLVYHNDPLTLPDAYETYANDIALQADGKILIAGRLRLVDTSRWTLHRYNPDGSLDFEFEFPDVQQLPECLGDCEDSANGLVLQPDGKIVVAGRVTTVTGQFNEIPHIDFYLLRFLPTGGLDPNFGNGGTVRTDFGKDDELDFPPIDEDIAWDMVLQPDGKIIAGGESGPTDIGLARYLPDGTLDDTFGIGGRVLTDFNGGNESIRRMVLQPDGKLMVTGNAPFLARYITGLSGQAATHQTWFPLILQ